MAPVPAPKWPDAADRAADAAEWVDLPAASAGAAAVPLPAASVDVAEDPAEADRVVAVDAAPVVLVPDAAAPWGAPVSQPSVTDVATVACR